MTIVLTGTNDYEITYRVQSLRADFAGSAEQYDGDTLTKEQLLEMTRGATLFSDQRCIIIRQLSENKQLWDELPDFLHHVSSETTIVLVEPKLDKRSKTYKWLQKNADVQQCDEWTARDTYKAEKWCQQEVAERGVTMNHILIKKLIQRAGVEQWRLAAALEKLELVDEITEKTIHDVVEPHVEENVFELLGAALSGEKQTVQNMVVVLASTDDAYRVFALLASQIVQLATLIVSDRSVAEVAAATKSSPYVLNKLALYAKNRDTTDAKKLLETAARSDLQMKQSSMEPWVIVESMLLGLSIKK
jgi:DNA polymerase-3 subunit delta